MASTALSRSSATVSLAPASSTPVLRKNLQRSIADGATFSLMVGLGETYLPAFVLFLGLGAVQAGLIATLPVFIGSLLQLASPQMVQRLKSYRRWIVLCACVQALSFLPLIYAAWSAQISTLLAFGVASVYWAAGLAAGPAWNSWMGTLVPSRIQTQFFSTRTRWTQIAALTGFLIGGVILHQTESGFSKSAAFAFLFGLACTFRLISAVFLNAQTEPAPPAEVRAQPFCLKGFLLSMGRRDPSGRALLYLLGIQLTAQIASPYFTPFMLGELKLGYSDYAILIAVSFVAKACVLPALGRHARRHGLRALLWFGGVGIVILPGLWLLSDRFEYLLFLQALSGIFWAAYDLASLLLIFETILPHDRTWMLTAYNVASSAAMTIAALGGALILKLSGGGRAGYETLFLISTIARAGTLFLLHGVAPQQHLTLPIMFRTLALRPGLGGLSLPLNAGLKAWRKKIRRPKSRD